MTDKCRKNNIYFTLGEGIIHEKKERHQALCVAQDICDSDQWWKNDMDLPKTGPFCK